MTKVKESLVNLIKNDKHTLRSVVEELEKQGFTPVESSEALCDCVIDRTVKISDDYILELN